MFMFCVILGINSDNFPKQLSLLDLYYVDAVCYIYVESKLLKVNFINFTHQKDKSIHTLNPCMKWSIEGFLSPTGIACWNVYPSPGRRSGMVVMRMVIIRGDIHPNTLHLPLVKVRFQSFTRQMSTHTHVNMAKVRSLWIGIHFYQRPSGLVYKKQNVSRKYKSKDTCSKLNWLEQRQWSYFLSSILKLKRFFPSNIALN
jgi:hypothetical protein